MDPNLERLLGLREHVVSEMRDGHRFRFKPGVKVAEMIGTGDIPAEFLETVTYNLEAGREQVPLLYKEIFETTTDRNLNEIMTRKNPGSISVVFLRKWTGGEVTFGDVEAGEESTVRLYTWAAGLEYDEDFVEYNKTYEIARQARVFGNAYNKLLNHLHLGTFTAGSFTTTGGGLAAQKAAQELGTPQLIAFATDVRTTLGNALQVLPAGSILLINSADRYAIRNAIVADTLDDSVTPGIVRERLGNANIIEYEGATITVGGKTYTYPGVAAGTAYLLVPKQNYEELEKHDLLTDTATGDWSRLIISQLVGRTRRGVYAAHGGDTGAVKIDLTA